MSSLPFVHQLVSRRRSAIRALLHGLAALASPFLAFMVVVGAGDTLNALNPAIDTFGVWLSVPVLLFATLPMRAPSQWQRGRRLLVSLAVALSSAFTIWIVQPHGVESREHAETLDEGVTELGDQVTTTLEATFPDDWHLDRRDRDGYSCLDDLGRRTGAGEGDLSFLVDRSAFDPAWPKLARGLSHGGWQVDLDRRFDGAWELVADRAGYSVHTSTWDDERTRVSATTPCLRRAKPTTPG